MVTSREVPKGMRAVENKDGDEAQLDKSSHHHEEIDEDDPEHPMHYPDGNPDKPDYKLEV